MKSVASIQSGDITDDMIHAYVDGALDFGDRRRVEAHLAAHPEDAARVRAYRAQIQGLHDVFDRYLADDLPERTETLEDQLRQSVGRRTWRGRSGVGLVAASLAAAVAGVVWVGIGPLSSNDWSTDEVALLDTLPVTVADPSTPLVAVPGAMDVGDPVAAAHLRLAGDLAPMDRLLKPGADIFTSLPSNLALSSLQPPDLTEYGFDLIGGRILSVPGGPTAQLLYEDVDGAWMALYVSTASEPSDTAFLAMQAGGRSVLFWQRDGLLYSLIGRVAHDDLTTIAGSIGPAGTMATAVPGDASGTLDGGSAPAVPLAGPDAGGATAPAVPIPASGGASAPGSTGGEPVDAKPPAAGGASPANTPAAPVIAPSPVGYRLLGPAPRSLA
ncbi:MAG: zf-HC2 domain-containing protein [Inquilinaceae bacterium]